MYINEAPSGRDCLCARVCTDAGACSASTTPSANFFCPPGYSCRWRDETPTTVEEVWLEFAAKSSSFLEKARRGGGGPRHSRDPVFEALAGLENRFPCCLASDVRARAMATYLLYEEYAAIQAAMPLTHFWHVTTFHSEWLTSDEKTEIRLSQMFDQVAPFLESLTGNYIAVGEIQAFANMKHTDGGKLLSLHNHAIVWGLKTFDTKAVLKAWAGRFEAIDPSVPAIQIDPIGAGLLNLARVTRYPLKAPCKCKTRYVHPETGRANLHESEKGDRFIRYNRLFEIQSMINLRRLFDAGGEGLRILDIIGDQMRIWAQSEQGAPPIHVDAIPDYWAEHRANHSGQSRFERPIIA